MKPLTVEFLALALTVSCGADRYGHSRTYTYWGDEERFARRARTDAVYDEVVRMPDRFLDQSITWFGIVTRVAPSAGGSMLVAMSLRAHQDRHLCADETEASCHVTINERDAGAFSARVRLSAEDAVGENRVQPGSLLRVYGVLMPGQTDANGGPVLRADFYRHWPRGQYMTTAAREVLRR